MKPLYEQAYESAQLNCEEESEKLRENYCNGYCDGVWKVIEVLSGDPEYNNVIDLIKWKFGIKR